MRRSVVAILAVLITLSFTGAAFLYSGLYNIAADDKHWGITAQLMQTARLRSVERHARDINAPKLDDPQLILKGAGQYADMCVTCHLAPGVENTALRQGLYPQPPELTQQKIEPASAFWIIKHGIKMSGMPAWGATHDDATVWSIVAFLDKLPTLSAQQYREMVEKVPADQEMSTEGGQKHRGRHDARTHSHKEGADR
jgi:mono/diheme cytochrome c family protein